MPYFSYHGGHSGEFCRHAKDDLRSVVQRAVELGFTHYGLSEHCPRDRVQDMYPGEEDLSPADLLAHFEAYAQQARGLQAEFADRIELLVGLETERLPPQGWAARMAAHRQALQADYIVGSVHDVDGMWIDFSPEQTARAAESCGGVAALRIRYFDALTELVTTLRPEVVGHLDLIRKFDGPSPAFSPAELAAAERTLQAAAEVGAVLDVNAAPPRRGLGPVYPLLPLLRRARAMGVGVTLGDDSHGVDSVGAGLDACLRAIADAGYAEVSYFARRDGETVRLSAALADVRPK